VPAAGAAAALPIDRPALTNFDEIVRRRTGHRPCPRDVAQADGLRAARTLRAVFVWQEVERRNV
jgi:hypothetical protein